jgi:ribosomal protein S27AE
MTAYNYAHDRVAVAVKRGELIKPDKCSMCGEKKIIMAHHNDYSKPLDIIWACQACHMKIHRGATISQGELVRTIMQLSDEAFEWLRQQSHEKKISISEYLRRIIDEARKKEEE